jgi:hypothetical protein
VVLALELVLELDVDVCAAFYCYRSGDHREFVGTLFNLDCNQLLGVTHYFALRIVFFHR